MSSIYVLEPPTSGHAVVHTTHGPLDLFLWSREAPLATRNFLQHAVDGYYDGLAFHRIVPGVLVQTGDPTGTGNGGVAAGGGGGGAGAPALPREVHGRLKFRRRGVVAMVAEGGGVRSQWFVTLRKAEWLDGEHSIFGYIGGEGVYNLVELGEREVEAFQGEGVPRVLRIEVVENPFPDVVKRVKVVEEKAGTGEGEGGERKPSAKKAVRSGALLSFGGDSGSDSEEDVVGDDTAGKGGSGSMAEKRRKRGRQASVVAPSRHDSDSGGVISKSAPADAPGASDHRDTRLAPSAQATRPDNAEIIRRANEEFERLKAELLGGAQGESGSSGSAKRQPRGEADAGAAVQDDAVGEAEVSTGDRGAVKKEKADTLLGMSKRRQKPNESETLKRLRAFENLVVRSRKSSKAKTGTAGAKAAWFAQSLKLGTQAMEEEEYEVKIAPPGHGRKRKI